MKRLSFLLTMIFVFSLVNFAQAQELTYAEWQQKLAEFQKKEADAKAQMPALEEAIAKLKEELAPLKSELADCQDALSQLKAKLEELKSRPKNAVHTVVKGECLWNIAGYDKYYGDPLKWPAIYRWNRDKIKDPNLIYPNWQLTIPLDKVDNYTVMTGDWLVKIAGYWEVYGDWRQWTKIYEANKDQIKDKNLIYPGQVFKVPR